MILDLRKTASGDDTLEAEDYSTLWFIHEYQTDCSTALSDGGQKMVEDSKAIVEEKVSNVRMNSCTPSN